MPSEATDEHSGELHGLLVVDKPTGWTSHDVVARARRLTGVRRIGHAGTLDPLATGVLPLGIGRGTRVIEYLSGADKAYRGTLRLGTTTDTDDSDGAPIEQRDWNGVDEAALRESLARFVGTIEQVPPAYSALKRNGVPMYKLARAGAAVAASPRRVTIRAIAVVEVELPLVTIDVSCSKGTYIRSLVRDLGEVLGCGAHLTALRRTRHGPFSLDRALTLDALTGVCASGALPSELLPPDAALGAMPALVIGAEDEWLVLTGRPIAVRGNTTATLMRAYGGDGAFLAVLEAESDGLWTPHKVFAVPDPAERPDA